MMIRKALLYLCLISSAPSLRAQIEFTMTGHNVQCNNTEYGSVEVTVNPVNPPYTYSWSSGQTTPLITGLTSGTYSVTITDSAGNDTLGIIFVGVDECNMAPEIFMTPNGDNIHDEWTIENSEFYPQARVMLFNRLGQKVFEHRGIYEPWNGKDLLGVPVPDASYYYVIYQNGKDEGTVIKGTLTVLR